LSTLLALAGLLIVPQLVVARTTPPATAAAAATQPLGSLPPPAGNAAAATADGAAGNADDAGSDNAIVSIGHDSTVAAGEHVSSVVSVLGSSTSAGTVDQAVVSVLGNTRVTGPVGRAAVAVLGNTYVDSRVGESVVAVLGDVELGPHADVQGDVVAVGGVLRRDPAALVHGHVHSVMVLDRLGGFEWLHSWVRHCLLLGRPLAFAPDLGWAWTLALGFLVLYLLIALLAPGGVNRCVRSMEMHPGQVLLAALFSFALAPVLFLLLLITVIGAPLIPLLGCALFAMGIFGKAVALAWVGRRVLPARAAAAEPPPVLAVLVGGLIALLLYVIPLVGFIAYKALGILGFGILVYTLILSFRAARATAAPSAAAAAAAPAAAPAATAAPDATAAPEAAAVPPPQAAAPLPIDHGARAGFWIRMLALLLDLILVEVIGALIGLSMHRVLLLLAGYGAVMWKLKGTTVGGTICGLRVVRLDGRVMDWPTAIARAFGCFLSLAVAGLGFIWVVFDPERQSWHDKIAGTVVVRAPGGAALV